MTGIAGLVPARFLTMTSHIIIIIIIFWGRENNVKACLSSGYTAEQYTQKDNELIIGLSVSLALFVIEFAGFFGGISMFLPTQGLISTGAHISATITLCYFVFDSWPCSLFWYVFGFCSVFPAVLEIVVMIGVLAFKKGM